MSTDLQFIREIVNAFTAQLTTENKRLQDQVSELQTIIETQQNIIKALSENKLQEPILEADDAISVSVARSESDKTIGFNSEEYWELMIPDTIKSATAANYKFHLKNLKSLSENDINDWFSNISTTYYNQRITLLAKIKRITKADITIPDKNNNPIDQNVKLTNNDYAELYTKHKDRLLNIDNDINLYNLFIYYLPTRRTDITILHVYDDVTTVDKESIAENYYNKKTKTFVFTCYKTHEAYGDQSLSLEQLATDIPELKPSIDKVIAFLHKRPQNPLFKTGYRSIFKDIKNHCDGLNLQQARHIWVEWGAKNLSQEKCRKLAMWMAHSYEVAYATYRP